MTYFLWLFCTTFFISLNFCESTQNSLSGTIEPVLYLIDILKMVLGMGAIIGGFGFFIATSNRRTHWHPRLRRIFFGIFLFSNIIIQALFNVANIPNNKKIVAQLSKCLSYWYA